jgi:hypothetical protein
MLTSLQPRKAATTPPARVRFLATALFLKNFESSIKAAPVSSPNDFGLSPSSGRSALILPANSEHGGQRP